MKRRSVLREDCPTGQLLLRFGFQPRHHGGCLQVTCGDKVIKNTFCKQRAGYKALCNKAGISNLATTVDSDWLDTLFADGVVFARFYVNLTKGNKLMVSLKVRRKKI